MKVRSRHRHRHRMIVIVTSVLMTLGTFETLFVGDKMYVVTQERVRELEAGKANKKKQIEKREPHNHRPMTCNS